MRHGRRCANSAAAISPTITVAGRSDPEIKALRLALNRLSTEAAWDNQQLRVEFEELLNLSFDLDLTAFDTAEIDHVLDLDLPQANVVEDGEQIPAVQAQAVSKLGDIWICGDHRLGCGNAHDGDFVARVRERWRRTSALLIRPTTCRSPASSPAKVATSTVNSYRARARCRPMSLQTSWPRL